MLAVENRSMSSSKGLVDFAAEAMAWDEMTLAPPAPAPVKPLLLSPGASGSSASKSSRFSDC